MNICQLLLVVTWFCMAMLCFSPVEAQDSAAPCAFPFIFKGITYSECTTVDDPEDHLWCSTKTDNQGRHIEQMGYWKHCSVETRRTDCKTFPAGKVGDCMNIQKCPTLNAILQRVKSGRGNSNELDILRNSLCSIGGSEVCCTRITTPVFTKPTPRPAHTNPTTKPTPRRTNPTRLPTKCGTNNMPDRIVGGTDAKLTAWPWMVILRQKIKSSCSDNNPSCSGWASRGECQSNPSFMNSNCKDSCNKCPSSDPGTWICGGVLITEQYVLTAAHCFKDELRVDYDARIGEFDLSTNPDEGGGRIAPNPQDIDIERVIKHKSYNTQNCRRCNDIALVKLAKPAQLHTFFVEPICLPSNPERDMGFSVSKFQGLVSWATGWGVSNIEDLSTNRLSPRLQQANLTIQELNFCRQRKVNYPDGRMILCAGQGDGKDTCRGDSGGPIMLSDSTLQKWYVVGITSFGDTVCGHRGSQSIFTSVNYYMDWIKQNIA